MVEIEINGGLTVIDAAHNGSSNFQVHLVSTTGDCELFVNEIGEYKGESASHLVPGTYHVDVEADGDWWLEVRQPRLDAGDELPQSCSDTKPRVLGPFEFRGEHTATCSHSGDRNFQVSLLPTDEQSGTFIVNEIGLYSGETTFQYTGRSYVAVRATDAWSLELQ